MTTRGAIHHVELWAADLGSAEPSWDWLLTALGYRRDKTWDAGRSWRLGEVYVVLERGPDVLPGAHERRRPGLNHLAFHAGTEREVEALVRDAPEHGWTLMFTDRHPHAGGPDHYAAYLENADGFEVELVALRPGSLGGG